MWTISFAICSDGGEKRLHHLGSYWNVSDAYFSRTTYHSHHGFRFADLCVCDRSWLVAFFDRFGSILLHAGGDMWVSSSVIVNRRYR